MRALPLLLASFLFAETSLAETWIVDSTGGGDFLSIQVAIDAASDGDVILVQAGFYDEFLIDGRSLTVRGVGPSLTSAEVSLRGGIRIQNVSSEQQVFVSRFKSILAPFAVPLGTPAIHVVDCEGAVRIEECKTKNLQLVNSDNVAVVRTESISSPFSPTAANPISSIGLLVSSSQAASFFGDYRARGASGCVTGEEGVRVSGSGTFFDRESEFFGGAGAGFACEGPFGSFELNGSDGGPALRLSGILASQVALHATTLNPGIGGASNGGSGYCAYGTNFTCDGEDGLPYVPAGFALQQVASPIRSATFPKLIDEGDYLQVQLSGVVGDEAVLVLSSSGDFVQSPGGTGVQLAGSPLRTSGYERVVSLGTLPTADWTVSVALPLEDAAFTGITRFAQVVFSDESDDLWFGEGSSVTIKNVEELDSNRYFCFAGEVPGSGCGVCPCSNIISPGNWGGCRNGNGTSCQLTASGEASLRSDSFSFEVTGAGTDTAALLNSADNRLPAMGACPIGSGIGMGSGMDGLRCIGGALLRHGVRGVDIDGNSINPWGFGSPNPQGGILANAGFSVGQTRHFQVFYRDNFQAGCGTALNTSNGVSVTVLP